MAAAVLLLLLAQAPVDDLAHDSRAVRDAAIRELAAGGPPSSAIVALLADPDERVALGAAEVLRLRCDREVLPQLARAADVPDAARGAAAAAALLATAAEARVDIATLDFPGMHALHARLDEAYRNAIRQKLLSLDAGASLDRPQVYRPFLGGGDHAARALRELAGDPEAPGAARAHALHALARLTGEVPLEAIDDPEPLVRGAAALLVLRYGDPRGVERLAARVDGTAALGTLELHCAALAVRRTGHVGPEGRKRLARAVSDREPRLAAAAAGALLAVDPEAGMTALRARVERHLREAERKEGAGVDAVIFALRAGPLPDDLRARMAALDDPLLAASVAKEPAAALPGLLERSSGVRESLRVEIVSHLLRDPGVKDPQRVHFAASVLSTDVAWARRAGLTALGSAGPGSWSALRPIVTQALEDRDEPVRVAAAVLLLPDPPAVAVCADALYDGDPASARCVAEALAGAKIKSVDAGAPVAVRRRASLELMQGTLRGKE